MLVQHVAAQDSCVVLVSVKLNGSNVLVLALWPDHAVHGLAVASKKYNTAKSDSGDTCTPDFNMPIQYKYLHISKGILSFRRRRSSVLVTHRLEIRIEVHSAALSLRNRAV